MIRQYETDGFRNSVVVTKSLVEIFGLVMEAVTLKQLKGVGLSITHVRGEIRQQCLSDKSLAICRSSTQFFFHYMFTVPDCILHPLYMGLKAGEIFIHA